MPLKQRTIVKRAKLVRDENARTQPKEIEKNGDQDQKETTRYAIEVSSLFSSRSALRVREPSLISRAPLVKLNDLLVEATTDNNGQGVNFFEFV